jgi:hypothetical protein
MWRTATRYERTSRERAGATLGDGDAFRGVPNPKMLKVLKILTIWGIG